MNPGAILPLAWQQRGPLAVLLLPLAVLFAMLAAVRRLAYRLGWLKSERLPAPVVVVGNIIVGGSGKTPLTLWLAEQLRQDGWKPGIVSRGYAASADRKQVREVLAASAAAEVGDEPLLLKRRSGLPVFVGRDRVAAGRALLAAYPDCDVILSDDGLQHYRLARDVEIALIDGRGLMNGWLLPAGPLREPPRRLARVAALVLNGDETRVPSAAGGVPAFRMRLAGAEFQRLDDPETRCAPADLVGMKLAAVAGIAVPQRFFAHLEGLGLTFSRHAFPDHHRFSDADLAAIEADALIMTEKDAVKCGAYTFTLGARPVWVLPVAAQVDILPSANNACGLAAHVAHCLVEKPLGRPTA